VLFILLQQDKNMSTASSTGCKTVTKMALNVTADLLSCRHVLAAEYAARKTAADVSQYSF
jgi:hypothetical protein